MQFLKAKRKEEFEMVAVKNPEIRRAVETLYQLSADGQVQAEHERRMKAMRDYASEMNGAYLEGKQDGRMDTALEAARKMKANNVPVEQIIEYLGLTEEQIKNLC
jgi:predicted transposase/invertase (TIGR01784 family)